MKRWNRIGRLSSEKSVEGGNIVVFSRDEAKSLGDLAQGKAGRGGK